MRGAKILSKASRFAWLGGIFACLCVPAHAETDPANSQVSVVSPGSFYKVRDLYFGIVSAGTLPGTVTVAPNGTRTAAGGVVLIGNSHHPAQFAGMKPTQPNRPVRIRVGSNTIQLTGPGAPMTVSLFRGNTNPAQTFLSIPRNYQVQQTSNGAFALYVGATLAVNANQQPGTYTGTWTITLDYQ